MADFDFDQWAKLAQENPEEFERKRKEALEAVVAQAPERLKPRLNGLLWRMDVERSRASNPLSACIRAHNLMADFVCSEQGLPRMAQLFREIGEICDTHKVLFPPKG